MITSNFNLPPGCLSRDIEGAQDMAEMMDRFFERLDDRQRERRDDAVLRAAERANEKEVA